MICGPTVPFVENVLSFVLFVFIITLVQKSKKVSQGIKRPARGLLIRTIALG